MAGAPRQKPLRQPEDDTQAAGGRPKGVGHPTFAEAALPLLENGYEPIPIVPGAKRPALSRWSTVTIDEAAVEGWCGRHGACGIGLRTGRLIGIDIDLLDADLAHEADRLVARHLGESPLLRIGRWPKRLRLYRTDDPFPKMQVHCLEVLGLGQQFVAFGVHEETHKPYSWPLGETPLEVPLEALPQVGATDCEDLLAEIAAIAPHPSGNEQGAHTRSGRTSQRGQSPGGPVRNADGLVVDGRDAWLSTIAFHAVHDAVDLGGALDLDTIAARVWDRFSGTTDLSRPMKGGRRPYALSDALAKVADKLRLLRDGRLPSRDPEPVEPASEAPELPAAEARAALDRALGEAVERIEAWHADGTGDPPRIGIRATVGLGKSVRARAHILMLRDRLIAAEKPARILVVTPSHALAEEAAVGWQAAGVQTAVLKGYEAMDPATGRPMCRDLEAVRAALMAGVDVHRHACAHQDRRCRFFASCAKQRNRAEVEGADVVVAAYDVLFTGLAGIAGTLGLILIDEGCWARAWHERADLFVESLVEQMAGFPGGERAIGPMADLVALRQKARAAMEANGPGPLRRSALWKAGLTTATCRDAAGLERRRLRDPGLWPGMPRALRPAAIAQARTNARILSMVRLWWAMSDLLAGDAERTGRSAIAPPDPGTGLQRIVTRGLRRIDKDLMDVPVLHLDATLRTPLASAILPGIEVSQIDVAAPHMSVDLIVGRFGKGTICPDEHAGAEENQRRQNRLREVVDHLRWQARRVAPGRTLVVTHQRLEAAFQEIPGVEIAHFNAIAGLDGWKDVRLLIVVGRPLPSETDVRRLTAALLGHWPDDPAGYRSVRRGVRMRDGRSRTVRAIEHEDAHAEILRAAVCGDELIQAIGRGRGVNRTFETPLEVQILADVALPLVHDRVLAWETLQPDIVQRMLLAGIAVDSPADAAALHPDLFANEKQAQKAFERIGFKRQNPLRGSYREMSLKSAVYRRAGRGRSWQRAWWIDGTADDARVQLEHVLGPIARWVPNE